MMTYLVVHFPDSRYSFDSNAWHIYIYIYITYIIKSYLVQFGSARKQPFPVDIQLGSAKIRIIALFKNCMSVFAIYHH